MLDSDSVACVTTTFKELVVWPPSSAAQRALNVSNDLIIHSISFNLHLPEHSQC